MRNRHIGVVISGKVSKICDSCDKTHCDELFSNILARSSDVPFGSIITYGCPSKLLSWAKSKQSALKDNKSHVQQGITARSVATFTDISQLIHEVIRNLHTYGTSGSCPELQQQLKPNLPQFCHLNRTIFRTLTTGSVHCCSTASACT